MIVQAIARSPWRVRLVFDGAPGVLTYTLTRDDGGVTDVTVSRSFGTDPVSVELALSTALLLGVVYVVTASNGATARVGLPVQPAQRSGPIRATDDPEAELYGVDLDWLAPLTATGDCAEVRGVAALRADLAAIARTSPGELFHRPAEGAGLLLGVNGPLEAVAARVRTQWQRDTRVSAVSAMQVSAGDGTVTVSGDIRPRSADSSQTVSASNV